MEERVGGFAVGDRVRRQSDMTHEERAKAAIVATFGGAETGEWDDAKLTECVAAAITAAVEAERERCAQVCDGAADAARLALDRAGNVVAEMLARHIRAGE